MYLVVSLLLAAFSSQSAWGSPILFPDEVTVSEVNTNGKGAVVLPGIYFYPVNKDLERKPVPAMISFGVTGTEDNPLLLMNISTMLDRVGNSNETETLRLTLPISDVHHGGNNSTESGAAISENNQSNETSIPSLTHGKISDLEEGDHLGNKQNNDTSIPYFVDDEISAQGALDHLGIKQNNDTSIPSLVDDGISRMGGSDHLGNKQTNEQTLSFIMDDVDPGLLNTGGSNKYIEGKDSEILSIDIDNATEAINNNTEDEYYYYYEYDDDYLSTEISTVKEPMEKNMKFNFDSTSHMPSEDNAEMMYVNDDIGKPSDTMLMFPTPRSPVESNAREEAGYIPMSPVFNPCGEGDILYQGECHQILSSGPCGEDKWLIMKDYDTAQCTLRPCPMGQIYYHDTCVYPDDSSICPAGQMLYVEMTGIAFCDCDIDYIYFPQEGTCIPEYEQGWCPWGEYLVLNKEGTPECIRNPCGISGSVYHEKRCYKKNYVGYCEPDHIEIKENEAECHELNFIIPLRNVFEVPTLRRCPKGSLRDVLHECRRRYRMPSIPSVLKAKHLYGGCPHGWTKSSGRKCKKIVNLFAEHK